MLDPATFDYLSPTKQQKARMEIVRCAAATYADILNVTLPPSPDKTYTLRQLREVAMWANSTIMRHADGAPRDD